MVAAAGIPVASLTVRDCPRGWYVGTAFARKSLTKPHVRRVWDEFAGDQAFALPECGGSFDESGWNE